ncbi:MAG TPA: AAA family ATPase [Propionibacteriaceae bacterium]
MSLFGRDAERTAIASLVERARQGQGGALVLHGDPGVGKSALLAEALQHADGMQMLRTQGVESESPLAFAAIHRLLRPVMRHVDRLAGPQAHALRVAFGEEVQPASTPGNDRFLVFLAALNLLAEAAESAPVLAVVDDAHWLDEASAAAVLFIARRLEVERVALLLAARTGDLNRFDTGDLPELTLGGIDRSAATALLTETTGRRVPPEVADTLLRHTGGNPLALVELPTVLSSEQLAGQATLPAHLPVTAGVERLFLQRCRHLPAAAQTVLLVAAADDSRRLAVVRAAAQHLGAGPEAWDAAEESGLVALTSGEVVLRHPLVRSAVYNAATTLQRRRTHHALATVLDREGDADRRAWHLAEAADEPDLEVMAQLDAVAERAEQRGGLEAASSALARAAGFAADAEARGSRLYRAARAAWLAGQPGRARVLVESSLHHLTEPGTRADAVRLRARIEWNTGSIKLGHRMVLEGARDVAGHDPQRAREMAMFATALASFGGDSGVPIDPVGLIPGPAASAPPRVRCFHLLLVGLDRISRGDTRAGLPPLKEALQLSADLDPGDHDLLPNLGIAALHLGDDRAIDAFHTRLLTRARNTGAALMAQYSLTRLCFTQIATGHWDTAHVNAREAVQFGAGTGQPGLTGMPYAWLLLLDALRGVDDDDRHLRQSLEELSAGGPMGILDELVRDVVHWTEGLQAHSRPPSAFHHLAQLSHAITRRMAALDRVEAAVRAEQPEAARLWVQDLDEFAAATGESWAAAAAAHGHALLAHDHDRDAHFRSALQHHAGSLRVFDRARTQLAYGEYLRRSRRRVDARAQLRAALETFEDLRARPWADRATSELRASGETARRRDPAVPPSLTPQELQVARLVGQGLSNREVATQLFVSPRTVDFHLRNVFTKAGVSSRTELARFALG